MRTLVILRGAPGSGKSTWIREMGLQNYTLCADDIRLLIQSPIMSATDNHFIISQENDNRVWTLLFEVLEERMAKGEFVIIDATHSRSTDFSRYNKLCDRYRYRKYYVDFSDVPIEECKLRNKKRESYKQVPDEVIDKIYSRLRTQGKTSGWVEIDKNDFYSEIAVKLFDFNEYEHIHIFGDIHGCFEPLLEYFKKYPYNPKDMYIFTGDYLDRGIQNDLVLRFLIDLNQNKNVLFLEGNHERWLRYYSLDEVEKIKSREFTRHTMRDIKDIDESQVRDFTRRLGQLAYFNYDGFEYIVTHGGIPYVPMLSFVATEQFISGVGNYQVNIDEIFAENMKHEKIRQVHAHRNTFDIDSVEDKSYNLEGKVEFGGFLKVLQLKKGFNPLMIKIKNNVFRIFNEENTEIIKVETTNEPIHEELSLLERLRTTYDIRETKLDNNISSFNFTRNAFYKKHWNKETTMARGLFINTETEKIVARGYEKFFNVNERRETEIQHLLSKFAGHDITLYKKENGFLGLLSYVNDELFFASKSTNKGDFVEYFKTIWDKSDINKDGVLKYLKQNDVTMLFEVIDVENDPHIIKYDKSKLVLLDIVKNEHKFERLPYEELQEIAKEINCECKVIYEKFTDVKDFYHWYIVNTDEDNMTHEDIEGVVIECNGIMTKLKFPFYNFWKQMRAVKEKVAKNRTIKLSSLYNALSNYFYAWCKKQDSETLSKDIITLRELYTQQQINEIFKNDFKEYGD